MTPLTSLCHARATRRFVSSFVALCSLAACGGGETGPVEGDLAIVGATIIDGTDGAPATGRTIVVAGDSIVAIVGTSPVQAKDTVDATGKWIIPGLWDMHVHIGDWGSDAFPLFIANGVTSVREMGGSPAVLLALRDSVASGALLGPTMLVAGPIIDDEYVVRAVAGTSMASGRWAVSDSASGAAAVDSLVRLGVDHIKVHGMTPRPAYDAIIAQAKARGLAVTGHVPDHMMPSEAVAGGQRTIEHNTLLELEQSANGKAIHDWMYGRMRPLIDEFRAKQRPAIGPIFALRMAAADSGMATFDSATAAAFAAKVAKLPLWFDPSLVVLESVFRGREEGVLDREPLKYVPAKARYLEEGMEGTAPPTPEELALGRKRWENALASVRALARGGAKIITGTDVPVLPNVPGFSLHRELQHLVAAGLTPQQAIQAATRNAAEAAGKLQRSGTVERGKRADFVVLDADPLASIANTTKISAVVKAGRLLERPALDSALRAAESRAQGR